MANNYDAADFERLCRDPVSRRAFLGRMTAAGLGVAAASLLSGCSGGGNGNGGGSGNGSNSFPGIPGSGDVQVLNYALALEILEADLYAQALNKASGRPQNPTPGRDIELTAFNSYQRAGSIGAGTFPGPGAAANVRADVGFLYLKQFAFVEAAHRDFLRAAITAAGGTPITRAQLAPRGFKFPNGQNNPGNTIAAMLAAILPLEETGVRAYLGAVPSISNTDFLTAAGTIYSTECRHSAAVRYLLDENDPGPGDFRNTDFGGSEVPGTRTPNFTPPLNNPVANIGEQLFEKFRRPQDVLRNTVPSFIA
jgi:hypothetical protein